MSYCSTCSTSRAHRTHVAEAGWDLLRASRATQSHLSTDGADTASSGHLIPVAHLLRVKLPRILMRSDALSHISACAHPSLQPRPWSHAQSWDPHVPRLEKKQRLWDPSSCPAVPQKWGKQQICQPAAALRADPPGAAGGTHRRCAGGAPHRRGVPPAGEAPGGRAANRAGKSHGAADRARPQPSRPPAPHPARAGAACRPRAEASARHLSGEGAARAGPT